MELILITNDPKLAVYAESSDVDTIMVDLEIIGKKERQGYLDTVISGHTIEDVKKIRKVLNKSKFLVRINPIHEEIKEEIESVISAGADAIMLPMFKYPQEVEKFINLVNGRTEIYLLLETPQALVRLDDILDIKGIDAVHIGLNDLHLLMGLDFMFELLSGGIVEYIANKVKKKNIKFGFGGVARLGEGLLPAELILSEHVRLDSQMVILSRSFKGFKEKYEEIVKLINLKEEIRKIRDYLDVLKGLSHEDLEKNKKKLKKAVNEIVMRRQKINEI